MAWAAGANHPAIQTAARNAAHRRLLDSREVFEFFKHHLCPAVQSDATAIKYV